MKDNGLKAAVIGKALAGGNVEITGPAVAIVIAHDLQRRGEMLGGRITMNYVEMLDGLLTNCTIGHICSKSGVGQLTAARMIRDKAHTGVT